jgi:dTMP kinase
MRTGILLSTRGKRVALHGKEDFVVASVTTPNYAAQGSAEHYQTSLFVSLNSSDPWEITAERKTATNSGDYDEQEEDGEEWNVLSRPLPAHVNAVALDRVIAFWEGETLCLDVPLGALVALCLDGKSLLLNRQASGEVSPLELVKQPAEEPATQGASGHYIAFEGPKGTGKSTQIALLAASLRDEGLAVTQTREPGATELGVLLREIMVGDAGAELNLSQRTLALLMAADRSDHIEKVVQPALARGESVISDRSLISSLAMQSTLGEIPMPDLVSLNDFATGNLWPDTVIYLDAPSSVTDDRISSRQASVGKGGDRIESQRARIDAGFAASALVATSRGVEWVEVDASESVEAVRRVVAELCVQKGSLHSS